jgi:LysR family transcriptional regulator for metE and metH
VAVRLEIRHFQLVVAVADSGSLAAASLQLNLTASALSHQLRDAEERLGARLFQRRHRRLLLTGAGERLLASARRVLAEVDGVGTGRDCPEDLIRISTGCYTVYGWLPPVLRRWQPEHPRVELRIVLEATRQPIPALLRGELDLALTTETPRSARLRPTRLFSDELFLLLPADHPLVRRGRPVTPSEVAREHLLVYDAPREQIDVFTRVLWPARLEPRRVSRVPLTEALIELVRGGVGAATVPDWMLPADRTGLGIVRLTPGGIHRRWSAVTLAGPAPPVPLLRFVELLRAGAPARGRVAGFEPATPRGRRPEVLRAAPPRGASAAEAPTGTPRLRPAR